MRNPDNTKQKIFDYIRQNKQARPADLSDNLNVSPQMIHRAIKSLVEESNLKKIGTSPKVFYVLNDSSRQSTIKDIDLSGDEYKIIDKNFYNILPDGQEEYGIQAFINWCHKRGYNLKQKAVEYYKAILPFEKSEREKYAIDVSSKIKETFKKDSSLDELWYLYPYSLPVFGKTKISQLIFHAKQTQDKLLMKRVFDLLDKQIHDFIKHIKPDAIAFIPPTVPRKYQIMKELRKFLNLNLPEIHIEKIKRGILIQQKSLKDLGDRIYNAEHTMVVDTKVNKPYKKILLIDDFTGSGSTLNQVAKKCKEQGVAEKVIGLTLTGSINGFDVLREI